MPRGKKARTDDGEKKESKAKGKSKVEAEPVVEEEKRKETTLSEITTFLKENAGSTGSLFRFRDLVLNSSLSRKLINTVFSTIFELVESTPSHFP